MKYGRDISIKYGRNMVEILSINVFSWCQVIWYSLSCAIAPAIFRRARQTNSNDPLGQFFEFQIFLAEIFKWHMKYQKPK